MIFSLPLIKKKKKKNMNNRDASNLHFGESQVWFLVSQICTWNKLLSPNISEFLIVHRGDVLCLMSFCAVLNCFVGIWCTLPQHQKETDSHKWVQIKNRKPHNHKQVTGTHLVHLSVAVTCEVHSFQMCQDDEPAVNNCKMHNAQTQNQYYIRLETTKK